MHWITGLIISVLGILFMATTESKLGDIIGMVIVVLGAAIFIKLKQKL